jgi:hypothetical protein
MERKKKICSGRGKYTGFGCGIEQYIFSCGCCKSCAQKASGILSSTPNSGINRIKTPPYKAKGEKVLFDLIWEERSHISQVSGKPLIVDKNNPFFYHQFSHILTKGAYPRFRGLKENIVLKTTTEHYNWEFKRQALKDLPEWKWVFELEEKLKSNYYKK